MKFIELNKSLKERVEPIYNLVGNDFFLIRQALTNLKNFLIQGFEDFNFISLDVDKLKQDSVNEQLVTMPIGNEYRMVVIHNPNQEIVKLLNNLNIEEVSSVVICVNAEGLKIGEVVDCSKLERNDIVKYILNYLSKHKLSIEEQALDYIIDATNSNMSYIVNELSKLVSYCADGEIISMDIVTNLVSNSQDYAIFMLTNAIDTKNYKSYQQILHDMAKSQSLAEIFSFMGKYFKRMQYIALSKDDNELVKILGVKPYAITMARKNIATNGLKYYINLYEKFVNLDHKIKSGEITPNNALYELIF
jgi:DNA polymerase-3 subunit delta